MISYYKSAPIICIYHGNCADGFGAAYAVRHLLGEEGIEYYPGVYHQAPPSVNGKHVIMVDFCYNSNVIKEMHKDARSILIIDHHKSAMEQMAGYEPSNDKIDLTKYTGDVDFNRFVQNIYIDYCECTPERIYTYFDMDRSGAMLAWNFFNPMIPTPDLIHHIQDRDLWTFRLPYTREIQAALFSYPYDFLVWDALMNNTGELIGEGKAIERKHHKDINELLTICKRRMIIAGFDVPVASLPYTMSSDAGHIMSKDEPFAACYWDTADKRIFSLRSQKEGLDVALIALQYGGGGHKNASGFSVSRDHELAKQ